MPHIVHIHHRPDNADVGVRMAQLLPGGLLRSVASSGTLLRLDCIMLASCKWGIALT